MRFIAKILVLSVFTAATFAYAQTLPTFQHIILIVQENRTPDNLFGSNTTFEAGVDLQQPNSGQWCLGACFDPGHRHLDWENEHHHNGSCPGTGNAQACTATTTYCNDIVVGPGQGQLPVPTCPQQSYVSGTYDNSVVAPLPPGQIGTINPRYPFADAFAPDYNAKTGHVPLADFFPLTTPRQFQPITLPPGAPDANYFLNYNGPILDPDNDVIDND